MLVILDVYLKKHINGDLLGKKTLQFYIYI